MKKRKIPMRKCIGCQEMKNKKELIRVVKTPDGEFIIDFTGKKNGRGAYLCKNKQCFIFASKNKGLEKSFRMAIPQTVYDSLKEEFNQFDVN